METPAKENIVPVRFVLDFDQDQPNQEIKTLVPHPQTLRPERSGTTDNTINVDNNEHYNPEHLELLENRINALETLVAQVQNFGDFLMEDNNLDLNLNNLETRLNALRLELRNVHGRVQLHVEPVRFENGRRVHLPPVETTTSQETMSTPAQNTRKRTLEASSSRSDANTKHPKTEVIDLTNDKANDNRIAQQECPICLEQRPKQDVFRLRCKHSYCRVCLQTMFSEALSNISKFPPKCCRHTIRLEDDLPRILGANLFRKYSAKAEELATPDRTYCANVQCGTFIPHKRIAKDVAKCPRCPAGTCVLCRELAHPNKECRSDEEILAIQDNPGWKRCSYCRRMVILEAGCNHITCICKHEFCYKCNAAWKTCRCETWDEANIIYQRQGPVAAARNQAVEQLRVQLREINQRFQAQADALAAEDAEIDEQIEQLHTQLTQTMRMQRVDPHAEAHVRQQLVTLRSNRNRIAADILGLQEGRRDELLRLQQRPREQRNPAVVLGAAPPPQPPLPVRGVNWFEAQRDMANADAQAAAHLRLRRDELRAREYEEQILEDERIRQLQQLDYDDPRFINYNLLRQVAGNSQGPVGNNNQDLVPVPVRDQQRNLDRHFDLHAPAADPQLIVPANPLRLAQGGVLVDQLIVRERHPDARDDDLALFGPVVRDDGLVVAEAQWNPFARQMVNLVGQLQRILPQRLLARFYTRDLTPQQARAMCTQVRDIIVQRQGRQVFDRITPARFASTMETLHRMFMRHAAGGIPVHEAQDVPLAEIANLFGVPLDPQPVAPRPEQARVIPAAPRNPGPPARPAAPPPAAGSARPTDAELREMAGPEFWTLLRTRPLTMANQDSLYDSVHQLVSALRGRQTADALTTNQLVDIVRTLRLYSGTVDPGLRPRNNTLVQTRETVEALLGTTIARLLQIVVGARPILQDIQEHHDRVQRPRREERIRREEVQLIDHLSLA